MLLDISSVLAIVLAGVVVVRVVAVIGARPVENRGHGLSTRTPPPRCLRGRADD